MPPMKRFLFLMLLSSNIFAAPNVVVSIKPIHSIVSNLMQDVGVPTLLLKGSQSAHNFHLRPSQLSLINRADLIISIHSKFETGLAKTLANLDVNKQIVMNSNTTYNNHSWLNISHMQALSQRITKKLGQIDPRNIKTYQKNLQLIQQKLAQLKYENNQKLAAYRNTQIATFSNALLPFLNTNHLQNPIVITQTHGDRLSIYKAGNAKQQMKKQQVQCLLSTIEIPKKRIAILAEGLSVNTASVDIIGFNINQGIQQYFQLMNTITNQVMQCLK